MTKFSIGDLISGGKSGDGAGLFSQVAKKADPGYDYSIVPERHAAKRKREEEHDEIEFSSKPKGLKLKKDKGKKLKDKKPKAAKSDDAKDFKKRSPNKKMKFETSQTTDGSDLPDATAIDSSAGVDNAAKKQQFQDRIALVQKEDNKERKLDPEEEARTVFVGNLPILIKKKKLKQLFKSYGTIETVRFRGAARPDHKTTKKVAEIKQKFHPDRKNINAFVRFSSKEEAQKSCQLNGSELEGHFLRVDMVVKDEGQPQHDQKKAIFLGNLPFNVHEDEIREGFKSCGQILDVRLIRDSATGMGKGFGFVNFAQEESVESALRLKDLEISGRKVRITSAVRKPKKPIVPADGKAAKSPKGPHKKFPVKPKKHMPKGDKKQKNPTVKTKVGPPQNKTKKKNEFQGVTTSQDGAKKKKMNKGEKKKMILAAKLSC